DPGAPPPPPPRLRGRRAGHRGRSAARRHRHRALRPEPAVPLALRPPGRAVGDRRGARPRGHGARRAAAHADPGAPLRARLARAHAARAALGLRVARGDRCVGPGLRPHPLLRGRQRVHPRAARAALRGEHLPRPLRGGRDVAARPRRGPPAGPAPGDGPLRPGHPGPPRGAADRGGRARDAAALRPRAQAARRHRRPGRGPAARPVTGGDDVRRHLGRRALHDARHARRARARRRPARGGRDRPRGHLLLRVVAARRRGVGDGPRPAARRPAPGDRHRRDLRRRARRLLRAPLRVVGLRPDRHAGRDGAGLPDRDRAGPPLRVLAVRLAGRVPLHARAPDHLVRVPGAGGGGADGAGDLRGARGRDRPRLHQGGDGAHLAALRAAAVPGRRGGAPAAPADPRARAAGRAGARQRAALRRGLV
ncbi:MAG: hypothetical protein AVDCRST_MAG30-1580, partial [uncultured Solirubrobacteraceae bacterium]